MDQLDLAVHATAHDFDLPKMARMLAKNEQVFRNKVNPSGEHHIISLREVVAMMEVSRDTRILEVLCGMFGGKFVRDSAHAHPRNLLTALLDADAEHGDVTRAVRDAMVDGRISRASWRRFVRRSRRRRLRWMILMRF